MRSAGYKIDKAQPPARRGCSAYASESVINIRRSMLDVRCSTFKLCTASARRIFTHDMGYKVKPLAAAQAKAAK